ncbi:hypothetical protein CAOG_03242 [Capsaspora owczarzaki ATCC 30864]|uniref:CTLH domain-containing protein n=1 Tax=Capsaspora owczarzaki (strain ATCC 30864) TaxID=595528 RepID=A0A0D2WNY8_CAPO3|nr:hypothetical protein CAOG_03242 [Capsaspora owczarzaki ATCC 30864]KJE92238.1 hypothetical protein CAOG_003242 [Capsaspora owczarzaki ATCC 30864]|eukprot:XP_004364081.2 hypothetical protein CAOG_03242 [Capsaspora owczarzaki ATCC 30864]
MDSTSAATKTITRAEWQTMLDSVSVSKSSLNRLVMNYLVIEGYKDAAERFASECGETPTVDLSSIEDRMCIRTAVQRGAIEEAIELVNDLNPDILDTNPKLCFQLQLQRLIELIRAGQIDEALAFAQSELAPRGEEQPQFLEELEKALALLAFDNQRTSPVGHLLDLAQRQKTASALNAAILASQNQERDPKLPSLLKMLAWAQTQLDDRTKYPRINDVVTGALQDPEESATSGSSASGSGAAGTSNGSVPMRI